MRCLLLGSLLILGSPCWSAEKDTKHSPAKRPEERTSGKAAPTLLKAIDLKDFGAWTMRLGDLTGDGRIDILFAQNRGQNITCLTAINMDGEKLWQVGRPSRENYRIGFDLPVQIYDIDLDGRNEVICVRDGKLRILDGGNGKTERQAPLPARDATDCIVIANFSGNSRPQDILLKTRYTRVWACDRDLNVIWSFAGNTGHYPWPYDIDGDGRDELMCGFTMLDHDGTKMWEAKLPGHADAIAIDDVDGNPSNGVEIALACCGGNRFVLLDQRGRTLWQHPAGHSQHVIIGDFRPDVPGKQICALDRGNDRSASGVDAMVLYAATGKQLWREKRSDTGLWRWITVITTVSNWHGTGSDLILAFRRGGSTPPTLYDGHGKAVARFPFPPGTPMTAQHQHFAQHCDLWGDDREEVLVHNEKALYIYTNTAVNPKKRLYNHTHYTGVP